MTEHFTRRTISAEFYCAKCAKMTQHSISDCRKGPCLECVQRLEDQHRLRPLPPTAQQRSLWGDVF